MKNRIYPVFLAGIILLLAACSVQGEKTPSLSCSVLLQTTLESVDFPATILVEDEKIISKDYGLQKEDYADCAIACQAVSVDLAEVIIVKPVEGRADALYELLKSRRQQLIEKLAFYPNQTESAEASVVGKKYGYVYLICHKDAEQAEKALLEALENE